MFLRVLIGCVGSSCFSISLPRSSITVSTSSITVSYIHNSTKTSPVPTQESVIVVESKASPIQPWWIFGDELTICIPNIKNVVSSSSNIFWIIVITKTVSNYLMMIHHSSFLLPYYKGHEFHFLLHWKDWVELKGTIPGNDSKNLATHYFAACGVILALPVLK